MRRRDFIGFVLFSGLAGLAGILGRRLLRPVSFQIKSQLRSGLKRARYFRRLDS